MLNVAIIAGGDSGEYDVSIRSGRLVEKHLDRKKYAPWFIEVRNGSFSIQALGKTLGLDKNDFTLSLEGRKIRFDVVFNAIHGTPGEDGKLQGYFDLLKIPYTSCGVTTSALSFNKHFCKSVVASYGVLTPQAVHLFRHTPEPARLIGEGLKMPVFIKPNNGGSSVGMSKVKDPGELDAAIKLAFHEDSEILAEEFISGRELTCGVLRSKGEIIAFPVTEIISRKEFFDYEAKYQEGMASEVVPAEVPEPVSQECRTLSSMLYDRLNCKGVVRFDYIYDGKNFWFLEVNTVPGMSEQSIVPKMARAHGWTLEELFSKLIEEAMRE
ncbi:MAG TPA: D-alanine--D-alanine ligase [Bacteroidales bacterium]|nr:D-alanine--D-alanine ligase [Bacteroidales bacterium]